MNLFTEISKHQPGLPGWCSLEKAFTLAGLVIGLRPEFTIEIGVYGGSSFIPTALAHKAIGSGVVIGIEPWSKEVAIAAQTDNESRDWWANQNYAKLESDFRSKLTELGLNEFSKILRQPSSTVEPPPGIPLLHVDGAHNDQAVHDVVRFASKVRVGGVVIMDDEHWKGGGVSRAILRLDQLGFKRLYNLGTGAVFQRLR